MCSGQKISCALWDSYAVKMNKHISENNSDSPVVVFLQMAKLKEWGGMPQVSNRLFGTRLHINDAVGPIVSFQERLKDMDMAGESSNRTTQLTATTVVAKPADYYLQYQIATIDEIPDHNKEIGLTIVGTIINIQVEEGWYYWACRPCDKIVTRNDVAVDGHPFNCGKCGDVSDVFGKVRVIIRVQDSTGSSSFVLFGRLIQKLINRSEAWLMDKIAKDQGKQIVPEEINMLLNRSVIDDISKRAHANEEGHVNDDGTPINKDSKLKHVDITGDNMRVIDLDASTPATNAGKRPIVMVEESGEYDCSSSKAIAPLESLKIPKIEKLD
uniref:uncharacterized protein LOC122610373 n=1 Tax=Erigeron canadensis TaxID=72917 RepID=UPI001CB94883|nr:uncharacterized protein LOC122610373 [Erigeron canadensis]